MRIQISTHGVDGAFPAVSVPFEALLGTLDTTYRNKLICSSYVFRMISLAASRLAFYFATWLESMTVLEITLDHFAPFRLGVVGLRDPSIVLSGLGVSLNSLVGLVPTLVLSSSHVDGSPFVGSTVDVMLVSVR